MTGVTDGDRQHLLAAVELSRRCAASETAFAVGAVVVAADGDVLATGFSGEDDPRDHAEEAALAKLDGGAVLSGTTIYSSLESCGNRASRSRSCTRLILDAGIGRVVFAWREPTVFTEGDGAEQLVQAGCEIVEIPELASKVRAVNAHLPGVGP